MTSGLAVASLRPPVPSSALVVELELRALLQPRKTEPTASATVDVSAEMDLILVHLLLPSEMSYSPLIIIQDEGILHSVPYFVRAQYRLLNKKTLSFSLALHHLG